MLEAKMEESEMPGSRWESNPGHLACDLQLSYDNRTTSQSSICTAQVVLKCFSCTPGSHSVCAVRTLLGVDRTYRGMVVVRLS